MRNRLCKYKQVSIILGENLQVVENDNVVMMFLLKLTNRNRLGKDLSVLNI